MGTALVRRAADTRFKAHTHPGREEMLVLEGLLRDEDGEYPADASLRNPRRSRHASVTGAEGALIYGNVGGLAAPFVVPDT